MRGNRKAFIMRSSKSITLTLGKQQQVLDSLVSSGEYDSASEAVRAALRALEREREAINAVWRAKIQEALADPRPPIPADEFFARMRAYHEHSVKASKRGV
jgi:antitoxin ParD1/3/4